MAFKFITKQEYLEKSYAERAEYFRSAYEFYRDEYNSFKNDKDRKRAISYFYKYKNNKRLAEYEDEHKNFNVSSGRISKDELNELSNELLAVAEKNIEGANNIINFCNEKKYPLSAEYKHTVLKLRAIANRFLDVHELFYDGLVSYVKL